MEIWTERGQFFEKFIFGGRKGIIDKTLIFSREHLQKTNNEKEIGAHSLDHALRVLGFTGMVCEGENWDPFLPLVTSLLIDLGRNTNDPRALGPRHGEVSSEISLPFVDDLDIGEADKRVILEAIINHPKLNDEIQSPTFVLQAVMDGDRLATLGPLSPMRAAATRWRLPLLNLDQLETGFQEDELKSVLQDVAVRQMRWYESLWTETAKKIAKPKYDFQLNYIKAVLDDVAPAYEILKILDLPLK